MGYLHDRLETAVRATIWIEINKDFMHLPLSKIEAPLDCHLFT